MTGIHRLFGLAEIFNMSGGGKLIGDVEGENNYNGMDLSASRAR